MVKASFLAATNSQKLPKWSVEFIQRLQTSTWMIWRWILEEAYRLNMAQGVLCRSLYCRQTSFWMLLMRVCNNKISTVFLRTRNSQGVELWIHSTRFIKSINILLKWLKMSNKCIFLRSRNSWSKCPNSCYTLQGILLLQVGTLLEKNKDCLLRTHAATEKKLCSKNRAISKLGLHSRLRVLK